MILVTGTSTPSTVTVKSSLRGSEPDTSSLKLSSMLPTALTSASISTGGSTSGSACSELFSTPPTSAASNPSSTLTSESRIPCSSSGVVSLYTTSTVWPAAISGSVIKVRVLPSAMILVTGTSTPSTVTVKSSLRGSEPDTSSLKLSSMLPAALTFTESSWGGTVSGLLTSSISNSANWFPLLSAIPFPSVKSLSLYSIETIWPGSIGSTGIRTILLSTISIRSISTSLPSTNKVKSFTLGTIVEFKGSLKFNSTIPLLTWASTNWGGVVSWYLLPEPLEPPPELAAAAIPPIATAPPIQGSNPSKFPADNSSSWKGWYLIVSSIWPELSVNSAQYSSPLSPSKTSKLSFTAGSK